MPPLKPSPEQLQDLAAQEKRLLDIEWIKKNELPKHIELVKKSTTHS